MRIALVKTSSMGDIIHNLPVVMDIKRHHPHARITWVVEAAFAPLLQAHPHIDYVVPIHWRKHRGKRLSYLRSSSYKKSIKALKQQTFDAIIDLHGLWKNALWLRALRGPSWGFDAHHGSEWGLARSFYTHRISIGKNLHVTHRARRLTAAALGYDAGALPLDYGLQKKQNASVRTSQGRSSQKIVLVPDTAWNSKHWPIQHWRRLAELLNEAGMQTAIAWGNPKNNQATRRIAEGLQHVQMLPWLSIMEVMDVMASADAVVSVDTGFAHAAVAMDVPTLMLFGPSDPRRYAALGEAGHALKAQCSRMPCAKQDCPRLRATEGKATPPHIKTSTPQYAPKHALCMEALQPDEVMRQLKARLHAETIKRQHAETPEAVR